MTVSSPRLSLGIDHLVVVYNTQDEAQRLHGLSDLETNACPRLGGRAVTILLGEENREAVLTLALKHLGASIPLYIPAWRQWLKSKAPDELPTYRRYLLTMEVLDEELISPGPRSAALCAAAQEENFSAEQFEDVTLADLIGQIPESPLRIALRERNRPVVHWIVGHLAKSSDERAAYALVSAIAENIIETAEANGSPPLPDDWESYSAIDLFCHKPRAVEPAVALDRSSEPHTGIRRRCSRLFHFEV